MFKRILRSRPSKFRRIIRRAVLVGTIMLTSLSISGCSDHTVGSGTQGGDLEVATRGSSDQDVRDVRVPVDDGRTKDLETVVKEKDSGSVDAKEIQEVKACNTTPYTEDFVHVFNSDEPVSGFRDEVEIIGNEEDITIVNQDPQNPDFSDPHIIIDGTKQETGLRYTIDFQGGERNVHINVSCPGPDCLKEKEGELIFRVVDGEGTKELVFTQEDIDQGGFLSGDISIKPDSNCSVVIEITANGGTWVVSDWSI